MIAKQERVVILSERGGIVLPDDLRQKRGWKSGTRLIVENTSDGVLLRSEPLFAPTRPEDVFGSLAYKGKPKTIEEMRLGGASNAKRTRPRKR
jgi:AbrB family looped-hinge helix DNA binding protein